MMDKGLVEDSSNCWEIIEYTVAQKTKRYFLGTNLTVFSDHETKTFLMETYCTECPNCATNRHTTATYGSLVVFTDDFASVAFEIVCVASFTSCDRK